MNTDNITNAIYLIEQVIEKLDVTTQFEIGSELTTAVSFLKHYLDDVTPPPPAAITDQSDYDKRQHTILEESRCIYT